MRRLIPIFAAILVAGTASAQAQAQRTKTDTRVAPSQSIEVKAKPGAATLNKLSFPAAAPARTYRNLRDCFRHCRP